MRYDLVDDFRFSHEPRGIQASTGDLIGRDAIIDRLTTRIARSDGGSFLLVGYRGVGKTSLANALLRSLARKPRTEAHVAASTEVMEIRFSLARPIPAVNLLHHILNGMRLELQRRGLYDRLKPAVRQEFDLAAMRTASTIRQTEDKYVEATFGLDAGSMAALSKFDFSGKASRRKALEAAFLPYDQCAAEQDVIRLSRALSADGAFRFARLRRLSRPWGDARPQRLKLIFVFDELDKLEDGSDPSGVAAFEAVLGNLKTLLTSSGITFVFIAGRGLLNAWERDIGRGDSILESIFSHVEYIPAVWNFAPQLCDALVRSKDSTDSGDELRAFTHYLTFYGRGVPRRTLRTFNDFVKIDEKGRAALCFDPRDVRRFRCLAELERCLAEVEEVMLEARGGRRESHRHDQDALALRYLADWIIDRGQEPFTMMGLLQACDDLNRVISPIERTAPLIVDALIRALESAQFLEAVAAADAMASVLVSSGTPLKTWRVPRQRMIELGRDLRSVGKGEGEILAGRYLLLRLIASGGTGSVYHATDLRVQRSVVVKYVSDTKDQAARSLLRNEAQVMARLDHPRLPRLLDAHVDEKNPFIVLEFIEGVTLNRLMPIGKPVPWQATMALAGQIIDALSYVHSCGLAWGDLKPSNVMVRPDGQIRLIDFGTLRAMDESSWVAGETIVGTPRYMAPECLSGNAPTPRADIYSLGILLYQLATGVFPFDADDFDSIKQAVLTSRPRPPAERTEMPDALNAAILRCLESDPAQRFSSITELDASLPAVDLEDVARMWHDWIASRLRSSEQVWEDERTRFGLRTNVSQPAPATPSSPTGWEESDVLTTETIIMDRTKATLGGSEQLPSCLPRLRLEVEDLSGRRRIVISGNTASVGRSADCDVHLNDLLASRYHARIYREGENWLMQDLNPINGILLNGQYVNERATLVVGTVIEIGNSQITVVE